MSDDEFDKFLSDNVVEILNSYDGVTSDNSKELLLRFFWRLADVVPDHAIWAAFDCFPHSKRPDQQTMRNAISAALREIAK